MRIINSHPLTLEPNVFQAWAAHYHNHHQQTVAPDIAELHKTDCPNCGQEIWLPYYEVDFQIARCASCHESFVISFEAEDLAAPEETDAEIIEY